MGRRRRANKKPLFLAEASGSKVPSTATRSGAAWHAARVPIYCIEVTAPWPGSPYHDSRRRFVAGLTDRATEPTPPPPRHLEREALMKIRLLSLAAVCLLMGTLSALAADWPQWRGPERTDISRETGLLKTWPKGGPPLLWKYTNAGIGFSGPAVVGDVLYTMGARDDSEYVFALDVKMGKELWHTKLGPMFTFKDNRWGDGPRDTHRGRRIAVRPRRPGGAGVSCRSRTARRSRKNLLRDFGGAVMEYSPPMNWGYCESPLVDGDKLVCCPGGTKGTMMALDKKTGSVLWRMPELKDEATDSSIMPAEIDGVRMYVQSTYKGSGMGGAVVGVDASNGKLLWYFPNPRYDVYAVVPTPIVRGNLVYATCGYNAGCNLLKISKEAGGVFKAEEQYKPRYQKVMKNEHGGVVLVGDDLYGYSDGLGWVCQKLKTGKVVWNEKNQLEGKGSLTSADGQLYLFSDDGVAALIKASPEGWQESGRFELPEKSKIRQERVTSRTAGVWTHPVVANGRLYLRDQDLLFCYDVREKK